MDEQDKTRTRIILGDDNYARWSMAIIAILNKEDYKLWRDHLDPATPQPVVPNGNANLAVFYKAEATCAAALVSTIDENNFNRVSSVLAPDNAAAHPTPSRDAWVALRDYHLSQGERKQLAFRKMLHNSQYDGSNNIRTWLQLQQKLFNRVNAHGGHLSEEEFVRDMVGRLPDTPTYTTFATMVTMRNANLNTIANIFTDLETLYDNDLAKKKSSAPALGTEHVFLTQMRELREQMANLHATTNGHRRDNGKGHGGAQRSANWRDKTPAKAWRTPAQEAQLAADKARGICNLHRNGRCHNRNCRYTHVGDNNNNNGNNNVSANATTTALTYPPLFMVDDPHNDVQLYVTETYTETYTLAPPCPAHSFTALSDADMHHDMHMGVFARAAANWHARCVLDNAIWTHRYLMSGFVLIELISTLSQRHAQPDFAFGAQETIFTPPPA